MNYGTLTTYVSILPMSEPAVEMNEAKPSVASSKFVVLAYTSSMNYVSGVTAS